MLRSNVKYQIRQTHFSIFLVRHILDIETTLIGHVAFKRMNAYNGACYAILIKAILVKVTFVIFIQHYLWHVFIICPCANV